MDFQPLCSVIIPAYNCERFIMQSIQSALSQTYRNLEVIVIDDCSTDSTYKCICSIRRSDSRIIALQNPHNLGVAKTRNIGFQSSSGDYIALLDGDDLWLPNKLQLQIEQLENTHASICCSAYDCISENGQVLRKRFTPPNDPSFSRLLKQNFIGCSTAVFRRTIIDLIQMHPTFFHEDYVFWLEATQAGFDITAINIPLVHYRLLNKSRSANKFRAAYHRWRILRHFLNYSYIKSAYYLIWYMLYAVFKNI